MKSAVCLARTRNILKPALTNFIGAEMAPKSRSLTSVAVGVLSSANRHPLNEPSHRKGPTHRNLYAFYSTLPKLPVPPLAQTLQKYLRATKAAVPSSVWKNTEKLVKEFGKPAGEGEQLQSMLEQRAKQVDNWLADWWLAKAYMEFRSAVPINSSPGILFAQQNYTGINGQLNFASKTTVALLEYKRMIDYMEIPVDRAGNALMDMSQYALLFGTCRIPARKRDHLRFGVHETQPANHIVVAKNGQFFAVPVYDCHGSALNEQQVRTQLEQVLANAPPRTDLQNAVGLLTSQHRDIWAEGYERLKKNAQNIDSLEWLERSLFMICLDGPSKAPSADRSAADEAGLQALHGGGTDYNAANRWFDKTLQMIIGENGCCGLTYEHSPAEGPPVAALSDFLMDKVTDWKPSPAATGEVAKPKLLKFNLSNEDKSAIRQAANNIDEVAKSVQVKVLNFDVFGKNFPKSQRLSPDSFCQLAFQLTFHKLHNSHPPTYETGTLRKFKLGRTDTIRLPSLESVAFVEAMRDPNESNVRRAELLRNAVQAHKEYAAAAMSGHGIDRHLLGLKLIALENGKEVPKILLDDSYQALMHMRLSTSQVPTKHDMAMVFGPMYEDGYGCCYNPQERAIKLTVTSFNSNPETSAIKFASTLADTFMEMKSVLETGAKSKM